MGDNFEQTCFEKRVWEEGEEENLPKDPRGSYALDRGRIMHSAAFRRLQGKTQVMGVREGDFHRTRLTHSLEAAQIAGGILACLHSDLPSDLNDRSEQQEACEWLPPLSLLEAACFVHDIGHPPFGHGGERALHKCMQDCGGFEGNAQTIRIITKLEKQGKRAQGINPTYRTLLATLKYGLPYSDYDEPSRAVDSPPKCYFDSEKDFVSQALGKFPDCDQKKYRKMRFRNGKPDPQYMTLDASIMQMADDIAYAVHDLEDIVARGMVSETKLKEAMEPLFREGMIQGKDVQRSGTKNQGPLIINHAEICDALFAEWHGKRKWAIAQMVNLCAGSAKICKKDFEHPLLKYNACHDDEIKKFIQGLKKLSYDLVIKDAHIKQLESRGAHIITKLFYALKADPKNLIPKNTWKDLNVDPPPCEERKICDFIAGMTDAYAEKIYNRLFTPGYGSSADEL